MPSEIFYFRNEQGESAVQSFLDKLGPKELARSLAQIDLLESDSLPVEFDRAAVVEDSDDGEAGSDASLRVLTARSGRSQIRFSYTRSGNRIVILSASHGKGDKSLRKRMDEAGTDVASEGQSAASDRLKSHREYVAEMTLSDPTLAALYSRARENAQFAVSVIRLRDGAGYTAGSLSERTGLSRARVQSIERGRMPKLSTLRRLVDALQARIVIAPGVGVSIEAYAPTDSPIGARRSGRARKSAGPDAGPSAGGEPGPNILKS